MTKILLYDTELSLATVYTYQLRTDYIPPSRIIHPQFMISSAWKWLGSKQTHSVSVLDDPKRFKKNHRDDYHVIKTMRDVLLEADIVVGHNGDNFDMKQINTGLLKHGLDPLPKIASVDTLKCARSLFKMMSNKLEYISHFIESEGKMRITDQQWIDAAEGDRDAINKIVTYNKRDVTELEEVYKAIRPYIKNHPKINDFSRWPNGKPTDCNNCGSFDMKLNKETGPKTQFLCRECGAFKTIRVR